MSSVSLDDLCSQIEVAGPGFVNLTISDQWLTDQINELSNSTEIQIDSVDEPRTFVTDYSSPNVAKPMHVGHIRSTVIGDSLSRVLSFAGHNVIRDNHLGDWGTQFGMIIYGYKHFVDEGAFKEEPVKELSRLYRLVNQIIAYWNARNGLDDAQATIDQKITALEAARGAAEAADPGDKKAAKNLKRAESQLSVATASLGSLTSTIESTEGDEVLGPVLASHEQIGTAVLTETAKLHDGDVENVALWEEFLPHCRADIQKIYDRLDIRFDVEYGESFYHDRLGPVVSDLESKGLARESEGAVCVFLDEFETPMIVRKRDGAFLYATTDLATIQYRQETWSPDAMLYVVDHRQGEHFQKLFAAAAIWQAPETELQHISFGTVLGEDGRPFKTRSGDAVGLEGLLDEAVARALDVVTANDESKPNGAELTKDERNHIADCIGHGAIKYADLSHNRTSDYVFSYEKMMALEGNTAAYMQYSYARIQSIFRRGEIDIDGLRASFSSIALDEPAERALALTILQFSEAIAQVIEDYRPNYLTNYLFDLAKRFSSFFEKCHVLRAESETIMQSRLLLCDVTARVIGTGLDLLGIRVVDKM
ncbi:MAG: arginine--tRNA ligase [Pirellulaceae bacterium]